MECSVLGLLLDANISCVGQEYREKKKKTKRVTFLEPKMQIKILGLRFETFWASAWGRAFLHWWFVEASIGSLDRNCPLAFICCSLPKGLIQVQ